MSFNASTEKTGIERTHVSDGETRTHPRWTGAHRRTKRFGQQLKVPSWQVLLDGDVCLENALHLLSCLSCVWCAVHIVSESHPSGVDRVVARLSWHWSPQCWNMPDQPKNSKHCFSRCIILSEPHLSLQHGCRPTSFQVARDLSRNTQNNYVCTERSFFRQPGRGLALSSKSALCVQTVDWTSDRCQCH